MDGERYVVELDFERKGDFGIGSLTGSIGKAENAVSKFKSGWSGLKDSVAPLGNAIDAVASKVWNLGKAGAMLGGGALFAGVTWGVTHLNNEMEKATISIGTIFNANGIAANVPQGMVLAKDTIAKMRVDAQKLPGEFEDLMNIFTTGAIPALRSGASVDRFRDLSGKAMAAGKVAQMDTGQVAREFAQLLEGRSGSHNVFGMKLLGLGGDKATQFNAMAADKRMALISKELDKYAGAIDQFGDSFDAQSSTLIDYVKGFGRRATTPIFNSVKSTMGELNNWFGKNQDKVDKFADRAGGAINRAFLAGKKAVEEWWPAIEKFGEGAYDKFTKIWQDAKPYVEQFGDAIRKALSDPDGTIDKLTDLAKLYIGFKVAQTGAGIAGDVLKGLGGVAQMVSALKMMGVGVPGAGLAAKAGGALYGAGAAAAPYAAAALPPALIAGGLWYGAFGGVKTQEDHDSDATKAGKELANTTFEKMNAEGKSSVEMWAQVRAEADFMRAKFQDVTAAAYALQFGLNAAQAFGTNVMSLEAKISEDIMAQNAALLAGPLKPAAEGKKPLDPKHKGGGGGTIQKVEIVVTGNNDPSRVARLVVGHIVRLQRNTGASPDVANYSALENT